MHLSTIDPHQTLIPETKAGSGGDFAAGYGKFYEVDMSSAAADITPTFPASPVLGARFGLRVTGYSADYELQLDGITVNDVAQTPGDAFTLFNKWEQIELVCVDVAGAGKYRIDPRGTLYVPCTGEAGISAAVTTTLANTYYDFPADTILTNAEYLPHVGDWFTAGNVGAITAGGFTPRRAGIYDATFNYLSNITVPDNTRYFPQIRVVSATGVSQTTYAPAAGFLSKQLRQTVRASAGGLIHGRVRVDVANSGYIMSNSSCRFGVAEDRSKLLA